MSDRLRQHSPGDNSGPSLLHLVRHHRDPVHALRDRRRRTDLRHPRLDRLGQSQAGHETGHGQSQVSSKKNS